MILADIEKKLFTLHTKNITYQMKVDEYGFLLHTYYGAKIENEDMSKFIQYLWRGFSGHPYEMKNVEGNFNWSLDTLPQEYSTYGSGDYRSPALHVINTDGSSDCDLRYNRYEIIEGKPALKGLPATYGSSDEVQTLKIELFDKISGIGVDLYYSVFEQRDIITRNAIIKNGGKGKVWLERAMSMCVDYNIAPNFDLMTFYGRQLGEKFIERAPLRHGKTVADSFRGSSSSQRTPFMILCDNNASETQGDCYGFCLVYSGSFLSEVEQDQADQVRVTMGIQPESFRWELNSGDEFCTPEVMMSFSSEGLGQLSRNYHNIIHHNLTRGKYHLSRRPILINNWEATYFNFTEEQIYKIAEDASKLGIEMLVLDDGWFGKRDDARSGLGDWFVNTGKLPSGINKFCQKINDLGMKFGLWFEPEMISEDSDLFRAHPDWVLRTAGRQGMLGRCQFVIDMSRKDVVDYLYDSISSVLKSANIEYVKWDANRQIANAWTALLPAERQGEVMHRYVLGLYDLLERLTSSFPNILFESCSGGGNRFDAGMLYYAPQTWASDNSDAFARLFIQYGTSFMFPVSTMGAHVSACPNHQTGRISPLETRGVVAMSGTFGYELDTNLMTDEEKEIIKKQVETYKKYYDLINYGDYYRLSDPYKTDRYVAWMFLSEDKSKALVNYVQVRAYANAPAIYVKLQGLKEDSIYIVNGKEYSGRSLMKCGIYFGSENGDMIAKQIEVVEK